MGRERGRCHRGPEHDLVLLDLRLPDRDGFEVCRQLRARSGVPIIVISARGRRSTASSASSSAPTTTWSSRSAFASCSPASTRSRGDGGERPPPAIPPRRADGRREARRALLGGDEIELTAKEFDLLAALAARPGAVVSRQRLLDEVWNGRHHLATKTIDVHVASLRRKLGDPAWIQTVRGIGFRLRAP